MPPKSTNGNSVYIWIAGALLALSLALGTAVLASTKADQESLAKNLREHELLDGHAGTLVEIKALRREVEQFRAEFRDYAAKRP